MNLLSRFIAAAGEKGWKGTSREGVKILRPAGLFSRGCNASNTLLATYACALGAPRRYRKAACIDLAQLLGDDIQRAIYTAYPLFE